MSLPFSYLFLSLAASIYLYFIIIIMYTSQKQIKTQYFGVRLKHYYLFRTNLKLVLPFILKEKQQAETKLKNIAILFTFQT